MTKCLAECPNTVLCEHGYCWETVAGFEDYTVNDQGDIFSRKSGRFLAKRKNPAGYREAALFNPKRKNIGLHRIVAAAFLPNPGSLPQVNHIDGNPLNNTATNLEWCTPSHNTQHAYDTGLIDITKRKGSNHYKARLSFEDVEQIRKYHATKTYGRTELANMYGITPNYVGDLVTRRRGWL
jgi:hypothetical protein